MNRRWKMLLPPPCCLAVTITKNKGVERRSSDRMDGMEEGLILISVLLFVDGIMIVV
jgi:hypothetical protein